MRTGECDRINRSATDTKTSRNCFETVAVPENSSLHSTHPEGSIQRPKLNKPVCFTPIRRVLLKKINGRKQLLES